MGWYLIQTSIEVAASTPEPFSSWSKFSSLFHREKVALWILPLVLVAILRTLNHRLGGTYPLLTPAFLLLIPIVFYIVVFVSGLSLEELRSSGWILNLEADSDDGFQWWGFWTRFEFNKLDLQALSATIPASLALAFFTVLHVPINVPALAMFSQIDTYDTNRELIAHGWSNLFGGAAGSVHSESYRLSYYLCV